MTNLAAKKSYFGTAEFFIFAKIIVIFSILFFAVWKTTTPYMAAATVAYGFLMIGIFYRRNRKIHIPLMAIGICIDLAIVLTLEIQRSAIAEAVSGKLTSLQMGHIAASTLAVVFYFPTVYFGIIRARSSGSTWADKKHFNLGRIAFIFRTIGFLLMFCLLEHVLK